MLNKCNQQIHVNFVKPSVLYITFDCSSVGKAVQNTEDMKDFRSFV